MVQTPSRPLASAPDPDGCDPFLEPPEPVTSGEEALATRGSRRSVRRHAVAALIAMDVVALILTTVLAYAARQTLPTFGPAKDLNDILMVAGWIAGIGWIIAIAWAGGYSVRLLNAGPEIYRNVLHACLGAAGLVGVVLYLGGVSLSRVFFLAYFAIGLVFILLNRLLVRRVLNRARARGRFRIRTLVVGSMVRVDSLARTISREVWLGYDIAGAILPRDDLSTTSLQDVPVLGFEDDLLEIIRAESPAAVIFAAGSSQTSEEFRRLVWELEDMELDVIVVPGLSEISSDRVQMRPVAGLPLVHMDLPRSRDALKWSKRVFDVVASALLLIISSPVMLGCALAVKLADGGPVIFRQQRVGRNGETFEFLKFRSMVVDAEARLATLREAQRDRGNDVLFKMARDPRITRPGRFLRRYSLDELPQFWNVLRGDMSLVGPRPALPSEVDEYSFDARRRLAVRPGITGLWQVSGRSDLAWDETVRLDLFYVDNWSFTQDIQILVRTIRAVLAPSGAY